MSKKLFVGGLSWNITKEILKDAFSVHGNVVSTVVVVDKETQKSRGFGFVDFATETEAAGALQAMHGVTLDGRTIHVRPAIENKTDPKAKRPFQRPNQERVERFSSVRTESTPRPVQRETRPSSHPPKESRPAPRRSFSKENSNSEENDSFHTGSDWGREAMGDQWGGDEQWEKDNRRKRREGKRKKKQYKKHSEWDDWDD